MVVAAGTAMTTAPLNHASTANPSSFNFTLENTPVSIDKGIFFSTVPSYATVARNYTVEVLVNNNSTIPIPIFLQLVVPVNVIAIHPFFLQTDVPPDGHLLANFSLIPFNTSYNAPINVSAQLSIWFFNNMSRPQLVEEVNTLIYGISVSSYSSYILALVIIVAAFSAIVLLKYAIGRRRDNNYSLAHKMISQTVPNSASNLSDVQHQDSKAPSG